MPRRKKGKKDWEKWSYESEAFWVLEYICVLFLGVSDSNSVIHSIKYGLGTSYVPDIDTDTRHGCFKKKTKHPTFRKLTFCQEQIENKQET